MQVITRTELRYHYQHRSKKRASNIKFSCPLILASDTNVGNKRNPRYITKNSETTEKDTTNVLQAVVRLKTEKGERWKHSPLEKINH